MAKKKKIEILNSVKSETSLETKGQVLEGYKLQDNDRVYFNALKHNILMHYDSAHSGFKYYQSLDSSEAASYYYLAQIEARGNYLNATLKNALKASVLGPQNKWYQSLYANVLAFAAKYDSAANIYFNLGSTNLDERNKSFMASSKLYSRAGEFDKALSALDSILVIDNHNEDAILSKQEIYLKQSQLDKAIEVTQYLVEAYPLSPEYQIQLAEIYDLDKEPIQSELTINKLDSLFKGNKDVSSYIFGYYLKRRNIDEVAKALNEYVDVVALNDEKNLKIISQIGEYLSYNRKDTLVLDYLSEITDSIVIKKPNNLIAKQLSASLKLYSSNPDKGVAQFKQLIKDSPKTYSIWFPLIDYYNYRGNIDSSLNILNLMGNYFPDSLEIPMNKMFIAQEKKDYQEALDLGYKGLDLAQKQKQKENEMIFFNSIASFYYELKNYVKSDSVFEALLVRDPENIMALNNFAYFLSERGVRLEYALNLSKKTLEDDYNNPNNLDTYGWILYKLGRYQEAKEYLAKAIEISRENVSYVILEHYADIEFRLGNKSIALKIWKLIDKDGKGSAFLKQKIKHKKIYE
ncbi:MAG TPA: tetratricopeptide repeat protein [Edaphocola sp.]|nr:tetratricopeptide repeat protein [Edaphocola sp.]